jgi:hypothetical protein
VLTRVQSLGKEIQTGRGRGFESPPVHTNIRMSPDPALKAPGAHQEHKKGERWRNEEPESREVALLPLSGRGRELQEVG